MPLYRYKAKEGAQKTVEGTVEASTREDAVRQIEDRGLFPIKIEETSAQASGPQVKRSRARIKFQEITIFSRQLATLIKSGVPILRALGVLSEQTSNASLKAVVSDIFSELKEGSKFSASLARYPRIFSSFYVAMVRAGEDSGNLEEVLFSVAEHRQAQEDIVSKVRLALLYPVIMLVVGVGTIVFMLTFVMPRLTRIFQDIGQDLPLPTKILISTSQFFSTKWPFIVGAVIAVFAAARFEFKTKRGKMLASSMVMRIPILGDLLLKRELARMSRTLELLIKSGVPILKAMELTAPIIDNQIVKESFLEGYRQLAQGASLGNTLRRFKVFPAFMTNLISIGEESGKLDLSLAELANAYEKDTDEMIKAFTAILEPIMILGLGLVIGFAVVGMLLPIFEINLIVR